MPEALKEPVVHTAGTATKPPAEAVFAGVLNRDADEIRALKDRCVALEARVEEVESWQSDE